MVKTIKFSVRGLKVESGKSGVIRRGNRKTAMDYGILRKGKDLGRFG